MQPQATVSIDTSTSTSIRKPKQKQTIIGVIYVDLSLAQLALPLESSIT